MKEISGSCLFEAQTSLQSRNGPRNMSSNTMRMYGFDIICFACHNRFMSWIVEIGDEFEPEFDELHEDMRIALGVGTEITPFPISQPSTPNWPSAMPSCGISAREDGRRACSTSSVAWDSGAARTAQTGRSAWPPRSVESAFEREYECVRLGASASNAPRSADARSHE